MVSEILQPDRFQHPVSFYYVPSASQISAKKSDLILFFSPLNLIAFLLIFHLRDIGSCYARQSEAVLLTEILSV